jgi:CheY-like chemotaxis protein
MALTYIIEDNEIMADLFARYLGGVSETKIFHDAISAISEIENDKPNLIVLDILLTGPDGFTFLNELMSYEDTAKIPIIITTSLKLEQENLKDYNVVKILNKESLLPADLKNAAMECLRNVGDA